MAGSGKSTAVSFFQEKGFDIVYFGAITQEELIKRKLEVNENNEKMIRNHLRKEYGIGAYALLSLPKIKTKLSQNSLIALDGIYSWEEVKILKNELGSSFILLSILASPKIRYERLMNRKSRKLTLEEAVKRDQDEIENLNKGGTIAMADYNIINETNIKDYNDKLNELLNTRILNVK